MYLVLSTPNILGICHLQCLKKEEDVWECYQSTPRDIPKILTKNSILVHTGVRWCNNERHLLHFLWTISAVDLSNQGTFCGKCLHSRSAKFSLVIWFTRPPPKSQCRKMMPGMLSCPIPQPILALVLLLQLPHVKLIAVHLLVIQGTFSIPKV